MNNDEKLSLGEQTDIRVLLRILDRWRDFHVDFPVSYIYAFLQAALKQGATVTELSRLLGCVPQVASRTYLEIGPQARRDDKPGFGLIEHRPHPDDGRAHAVYLTPKGKRILAQMLDDLEPVRRTHHG